MERSSPAYIHFPPQSNPRAPSRCGQVVQKWGETSRTGGCVGRRQGGREKKEEMEGDLVALPPSPCWRNVSLQTSRQSFRASRSGGMPGNGGRRWRGVQHPARCRNHGEGGYLQPPLRSHRVGSPKTDFDMRPGNCEDLTAHGVTRIVKSSLIRMRCRYGDDKADIEC